MSRRFPLSLILILLLLLFSVLVLYYLNFSGQREVENGKTPSPPLISGELEGNNVSEVPGGSADSVTSLDANPIQNIPQNEIFLVIEENGRIAVYRQGESDVLYFADQIDLSALPRSDQEHLKTGIRVEGAEGLARLLEDFSG
jgi:hypothetical protein